jgi:hypothetical protein
MADDEALRTLEEWIDKLEDARDLCRRGLLRSDEPLELETQMQRELRATLPPSGTASRVFELGVRELPLLEHDRPSGKAGVRDGNHLWCRVSLLRDVAEQFGPEALPQTGVEKRQHHIPAGEPGRARRLLYGLMSKAAADLLVVDAYADESAFPYLESLEPALQVRVLGGRRLSPAVKAILEGYQQQGRKFEIRRGSAIHDRYLVIDGAQVWSLGASINGLGAKAHTLSRIDDDAERTKIIAELEAAWLAGTSI